jgi:RNA-directed DNA polymerase
MDAGQQKTDHHHGGPGEGGTHSSPLGPQQTSTASPQPRALTVNLMEQVCDPKNLLRAYRRVRSNKGKPGVDGRTVHQLLDWLRENVTALTASLRDGSYQPLPVRGIQLRKPDGGKRQLGIPVVVDRMVQQAILQVLEPIFDPTFSNSSYGFRQGRSAHMALEQARKYVAQEGREFVVDLDLEKFFDRVNHDILMSRIARRIGDKHLLRILRRFLRAGWMQEGVCIARDEGTPQGGPLSPVLANLLLNDLDQLLEKRGHHFCRYADDCNIYVRSLAAGQRVMASVTRYLEGKLKLRVNRDKSAVAPVGERKFLGHKLLLNGQLGISPKSLVRAQERIRQITSRNRGVSFDQGITELNSFLSGWLTFYRFAAFRFDLQCLDEWIRRKLRCYRLKPRKRGKSVSSLLRKLGLSVASASRVGSSGKGPWRLAHCPPVHRAMSIKWFLSQGLVSLVAKYDALQH